MEVNMKKVETLSKLNEVQCLVEIQAGILTKNKKNTVSRFLALNSKIQRLLVDIQNLIEGKEK